MSPKGHKSMEPRPQIPSVLSLSKDCPCLAGGAADEQKTPPLDKLRVDGLGEGGVNSINTVQPANPASRVGSAGSRGSFQSCRAAHSARLAGLCFKYLAISSGVTTSGETGCALYQR